MPSSRQFRMVGSVSFESLIPEALISRYHRPGGQMGGITIFGGGVRLAEFKPGERHIATGIRFAVKDP